MGLFFTNLQVYCPDGPDASTAETLANLIARSRGWTRVASPRKADIKTVVGHEAGSPWVTVVSDAFDGDPDAQLPLGREISKQLQTPVLALFNFDSDLLCITRIDGRTGEELWAYAGDPAMFDEDDGEGMPLADYSAWQAAVPDPAAFEAIMTQDYVFSEECLPEVENLLRLPLSQSMAGIDCAEELPGAQVFYFAIAKDATEPPCFETHMHSVWASFDEPASIHFVNRGKDTRGVDVILTGDDLVSGALTVTKAELLSYSGMMKFERIPITFAPRAFSDGVTRLYAHLPELPAKGVPKGLPIGQEMKLKDAAQLELIFTLQPADPARTEYAPVTAIMVPTENWGGQGACMLEVKP